MSLVSNYKETSEKDLKESWEKGQFKESVPWVEAMVRVHRKEEAKHIGKMTSRER